MKKQNETEQNRTERSWMLFMQKELRDMIIINHKFMEYTYQINGTKKTTFQVCCNSFKRVMSFKWLDIFPEA